MWTSLRDAAARAGSFDALVSRLKKGDIAARAAAFFNSEGTPKKRKDNLIPGWWWEQLRNADPAADRAVFWMITMLGLDPNDKDVTEDVLAIGIELERAAVESLWPGVAVPAPEKPSNTSSTLKLTESASGPAPPANPAQQVESAGTKRVVRSRKRRIQEKPQQGRVHKVLKTIWPISYPTREEVSDADVWDVFCKKYKEMEKAGRLGKSKYGQPSRQSVMREVGRKD